MNLKLTSLVFFIILLAPAVATYCWLTKERAVIRKEVKWKLIAGIDKAELVQLKFSKADSQSKLQWKHSREFAYDQEMYDIVETLVEGDSIIYWCWWDHKETSLNKKLNTLLTQTWDNNPGKKQKQEHLFSFLKNLYYPSKNAPAEISSFIKKEKLYTPTFFFTLYLSPPPFPPPDKV